MDSNIKPTMGSIYKEMDYEKEKVPYVKFEIF